METYTITATSKHTGVSFTLDKSFNWKMSDYATSEDTSYSIEEALQTILANMDTAFQSYTIHNNDNEKHTSITTKQLCAYRARLKRGIKTIKLSWV